MNENGRIEAKNSAGIEQFCFESYYVAFSRFLMKTNLSGLSPRISLISQADFIAGRYSSLNRNRAQRVFPACKCHAPMQSRGGKIPAVSAHDAHRNAIQKKFRVLAVGIYMHVALFARLAPADRPAMPKNVNHRFLGPVGLKNVIGFLSGQIAFHDPLLIHTRNGVAIAQWSGKVLENPLRRPGKPIYLLLGFEVPVEEIAGIGLRPVAILGYADIAATIEVIHAAFVGPDAGGHLAQHRIRVFRMTAGMAVRSPFSMDESLHAVAPGGQALLVLAVVAPVPSSPDRGRVDIGNIARKVAAAKRGQPGAIEPMRKVAHLGHEGANRLLIEDRILVWPVVLIAQSPENDGGVIVMLVDHVREHIPDIALERLVPHPGSAPRNLFPNQQAELIAQIEHQPILLVMRQPDEVGAHLADHLHFLAYQVVAHCGSHPCMIGMAMCAAQKHAL